MLFSMNVSRPIQHGGIIYEVIASIFSRLNPPLSCMAFFIALHGLMSIAVVDVYVVPLVGVV